MIISGASVCLLIFISALMRYRRTRNNQNIFLDFYGYEEITLFIAFWLYFTGSMYAAKNNTHIDANMISMFVDNEKVVKIFDLIRSVITFILTVIVTAWCFKYVKWQWGLHAKSNVFKLPNIIAQIPIFISFFVWNFYVLRDIIVCFRSLKYIEITNKKENEEGVIGA